MSSERRAIAWFRRDLRLDDNRMLAEATARAAQVIPIFVADPAILERHATARPRVAWFAAALRDLDAALVGRGSGLAVLAGDPSVEIRRFAAAVGADAVYAARDEEPEAIARDSSVGEAVTLHLVDDQRLVPPHEIRTQGGEPFRVYTPFRRALDARLEADGEPLLAEALPDLSRLARRPDGVGGAEAFPTPDPGIELPRAGSAAAAQRLREFARRDLRRYRAERDRPDLDTTSRISAHLRVGALSIRAAWRAALDAERGAAEDGDREMAASARRWRDELAWREFYASVLHHEPGVIRGGHRRAFDAIRWEQGPAADEALQAWRTGRTGYPVVDAGMRQLAATGWMHNRLRLITASFLVKDLGIDWRRGESVFMEHLLDGDVAQNSGNWQWVAGVGTDAAPYFRVFNPVLQGKRFDPDGSFVRAWLPELERVPAEVVHEPWRAPNPEMLGEYPRPIVDHAAARHRTLARYRAAAGGRPRPAAARAAGLAATPAAYTPPTPAGRDAADRRPG